MLGNTFLAMSLFLPVNIIKAAANFFPLSRIPASFRGEVGGGFPQGAGAGAVQSRGSNPSTAREYFSWGLFTSGSFYISQLHASWTSPAEPKIYLWINSAPTEFDGMFSIDF